MPDASSRNHLRPSTLVLSGNQLRYSIDPTTSHSPSPGARNSLFGATKKTPGVSTQLMRQVKGKGREMSEVLIEDEDEGEAEKIGGGHGGSSSPTKPDPLADLQQRDALIQSLLAELSQKNLEQSTQNRQIQSQIDDLYEQLDRRVKQEMSLLIAKIDEERMVLKAQVLKE